MTYEPTRALAAPPMPTPQQWLRADAHLARGESVTTLSGDTLTKIGGALVLACSTATGYVVARWNTATQIRVARMQTEAAAKLEAERLSGEAQRRAAELTVTTKIDSEKLIDARADRVEQRIERFIALQTAAYDALRAEHEKVLTRLSSVEETNRVQRRDMDAMAQRNAELEAKVVHQDDRILGLQSVIVTRNGLMDRLHVRFTAAITYIETLTRQLLDLGHAPASPPAELSDPPLPQSDTGGGGG